MFYKRRGVPKVGDMFNYRRVTEVYTGFETETYWFVKTPASRYGSSTAPWAARQSQIEAVGVVDDGIVPKSISVWFANMTSLKHADVARLDTSGCIQMVDTFFCAAQLESLDLSSWNVSGVYDFNCMFQNCHSLKDVDMRGWSARPRSGERGLFGMFFDCASLKSLDLSASISLRLLVPTRCSATAHPWQRSPSAPTGNGSYSMTARARTLTSRSPLLTASPVPMASGIASLLARDTRRRTSRATSPIPTLHLGACLHDKGDPR